MSAGHSHIESDAAGNQPSSPRARRLTLAVLVPAAVLIMVAMVVMWPHSIKPDEPAAATEPLRSCTPTRLGAARQGIAKPLKIIGGTNFLF